MSYEGKIVAWVLGSGFSRSLGGPLLADLFRKEDELAARDLLTGEVNNVYRLFEQCTSRRYVGHAEQFLEFIDTATRNPVRARMLERFWKGVPMDTIRDTAVKVVAAECDFLAEADTNEEGWQPYQRWRSEFLEKNHVVINFNYDLVLETLGEVAMLPDESTYKNPQRVLKLHGSIDWTATGTGVKRGAPAEFRAPRFVPLIATPGPTKLKHSSDEQRFKNLWTYARNVLKQAHVIVFLGYRFPPSDSHARTQLLGSIGDNEVQHLRIHTVLGPETNHENSVRLTKLLEHTLSRKRPERNSGLMGRVINQPMHVEDFLSVLHERILYEQWPA